MLGLSLAVSRAESRRAERSSASAERSVDGGVTEAGVVELAPEAAVLDLGTRLLVERGGTQRVGHPVECRRPSALAAGAQQSAGRLRQLLDRRPLMSGHRAQGVGATASVKARQAPRGPCVLAPGAAAVLPGMAIAR